MKIAFGVLVLGTQGIDYQITVLKLETNVGLMILVNDFRVMILVKCHRVN